MHLDIVALTVAFLAVLAVGSVAASVLAFRGGAGELRRRLGTAAPDGLDQNAGGLGKAIVAALAPLAKVAGVGSEGEMPRMRQQLAWAGYRGEYATQIYLASKLILAFGALLGFAFVNASRAKPIPMALPIMAWVCGGAYFLPNLVVRVRGKARQTSIERALPDTLDLLVTCVEAGLGLDAGMQRVATETAHAFPLLSKELTLTHLEVNAGIPRVEALRRLAERTGVVEMRSLAATLAQTELFGTSVGDALRVQAEGMRIRRMQRAEEKAGYLAVKMTIPLVLLIFPAIFCVILGPAVVRIVRTLLPILGGSR